MAFSRPHTALHARVPCSHAVLQSHEVARVGIVTRGAPRAAYYSMIPARLGARTGWAGLPSTRLRVRIFALARRNLLENANTSIMLTCLMGSVRLRSIRLGSIANPRRANALPPLPPPPPSRVVSRCREGRGCWKIPAGGYSGPTIAALHTTL